MKFQQSKLLFACISLISSGAILLSTTQASTAQQVPPYPLQPDTNFIRPDFDDTKDGGQSTPQTNTPIVKMQSPPFPNATKTDSLTTKTIGKEIWQLGGITITGTPTPSLEAFDRTMVQFMKQRNIKAATLAVMKEGKLLLARGYGHTNPNQAQPIAPDTTMRIASISKSFTSAAIKQLIQQGKITSDTPVFPFLGLTQGRDPRLNTITVQHLLNHQGGWDSKASSDPMFQAPTISQALGKNGPPNCPETISYMLNQPLDFSPGSRSVYSNFGYCVLGRVIEKASGQTYLTYLQNQILNPIGINDLFLGRTLPQQRQPKEVSWYFDPESTSSLLENGREVAWPNGGFYLEAMDAHGGIVTSSISLVKFGQAFWVNGDPRKPGESRGMVFFGSLPGTLSMLSQAPNGITIAVLFNQRRVSEQDDQEEYMTIQKVLEQVAAGIQ
jgi:CubicO group peptidase (beta-lactamase class C family)